MDRSFARSRMLIVALTLLAALGGAVGTGTPAHPVAAAGNQTQYTITEIAPPAGYTDIALSGGPSSLNFFGQVVGSIFSTAQDGTTLNGDAFFTGPNGAPLTILRGIGSGNIGPGAINDLGVIIGGASKEEPPYTLGFVTGPNGTLPATELPPISPGHLAQLNNTGPAAINAGGTVAGRGFYCDPFRNTYTCMSHAFLYRNGAMTDLGSLGGPSLSSEARDINASGQVVGGSCTVPGPTEDLPAVGCETSNRAFRTGQNGAGMTSLGSLGGPSAATAISDGGDVIGSSCTVTPPPEAPGCEPRPFVYRNGAMTDLRNLVGAFFAPSDIADPGHIVGYTLTVGPGMAATHAAILYSDTSMVVDLNTRLPNPDGWILETASAINGVGQIAGMGTHNGYRRAYLLTPTCSGRLIQPGQATAVADSCFRLTVATNDPAVKVTLNPPGATYTGADFGGANQLVATYAQGATVTITVQPAPTRKLLSISTVGPSAGPVFVSWSATQTVTMDQDLRLSIVLGDTTAGSFADVPAGDLAANAIANLAARGIIRGCDQTANPPLFCPQDRTKRAQMAALIARAMPRSTGDPVHQLTPPACLVALTWDCESWPNAFSDQGVADNALWSNVATLQHYGVVLGYTAATCVAAGLTPPCYGPTDDVLHAQALSFISRAMVQHGYWQAQPIRPALYGGVLNGTGHEQDAATFIYYTAGRGGVPDYPDSGAFPVWDQPTTRGWFARALWAALDSYYGTPQTP